MTGADRVAAAQREPGKARWFRAPGRVNLIGDHTDYNDGFVLPIAIERECVVAVQPHAGGRVRMRSLDVKEDEAVVDVPADGSADPASVRPSWGRYVAGVVRALSERGRSPVGLEGVLASSVPIGSGLSSSAALEVACALALSDMADLRVSERDLALACQAGEHLATGVPSGIMDQLTSIAGKRGAALLIDCRTLVIEAVPLPRELAVLAVDSGVRRTLEASAYADRRAECRAVAASLGLDALRDATLEQVRDIPVARHVVTENARVLAARRALAEGDLDALGDLLAESHASLRDDFRVSTPELDLLIGELTRAGALGARLTGAGFGGAVVALVPAEQATTVADTAVARYAAATGLQPTAFVCPAVDGAGPLDPP